jgi:hypothetical protein
MAVLFPGGKTNRKWRHDQYIYDHKMLKKTCFFENEDDFLIRVCFTDSCQASHAPSLRNSLPAPKKWPDFP